MITNVYPTLRVFLGCILLGGGIPAVIEDLTKNGTVEDGGDDVIDDGEKITSLDPGRRDPDDATEEEKTHRDGR